MAGVFRALGRNRGNALGPHPGLRNPAEQPVVQRRQPATADLSAYQFGVGRELFQMFRANASTADTGGTIFAGLAQRGLAA